MKNISEISYQTIRKLIIESEWGKAVTNKELFNFLFDEVYEFVDGCTSIDALAVGITYAFLQVQILPAITFIGAVTFSLSVAGVKIGNLFGLKYKSRAEIAGGVILILMGTKILLEHLGVL